MASTSSDSSFYTFRKDFYVSIVGYISNQIVGAKLPSNQQVLRVFFYNVRVVNLTTKESAALVIQEVSIFWQKARIPSKRTDHCIDKLLKLYDEWKGLQKNLTRTSGKEKEKRDLFIEKMDDLFDIAHSDALEQMKNEDDKKFLILQRQKGRPGSMIGVDQKLKYKEERAPKRSAMESVRKKRTYEEMVQQFATCQPVVLKTTDSISSSQNSDSNTGRINGACINLEKLFNRDLLYLPCRHHIFELVLRSCFDLLMDATTGPDMPLFKRFRETWAKIDKNVYITDKNEVLYDVRSTIIHFIEDQLATQKQLRDDYRELLELTMIFLKKNSLRRICIFLARVYVRAWFLSPDAIKAPYHDFLFMHQLLNYQAIDPKISKATAKKFSKHLWYLVPETVALSFFDDNVPIDVKTSMTQVMLEVEGSEEQEEDTNQFKRYILHPNDFSSFSKIKFPSFVTSSTRNFFTRFSISSDFLYKDPSTWKDDVGYKSGIEKLQTIIVVNDVAERGIKLIQDYNNILTKDEVEKQFILQIIARERKKTPTATNPPL